MNCNEARDWLLGAEDPGRPPLSVQTHLQGCSECGRVQHRLLCLIQEVKAMPRPGESPDGRRQLFAKLDQLPAPVAVSLPFPRRALQLRRTLVGFASLAAALILLAIGVVSFWPREQSLVGPKGPVAVTPTSPRNPQTAVSEDALVGRILEHDLRLAEVSSPREQLQTLVALAADLRSESMELARQGARDEMPTLSALYQRVVGQGLVDRARTLPDSEKKDVLPRLIRELQDAATESDRAAAERTDSTGVELRALARSMRHAAERLTNEGLDPQVVPEAPAPKPGKAYNLAGALVFHGLRLAKENDPLRRADTCTDIADSLVQTILEASVAGEEDRAKKLGQQLNAIMDRGVSANLVRVVASTTDSQRLAEAERISRRAGNATSALERNLERAPAAARPGLERALEASSHGRERAMQAGKGKGKGKGKGNQSDENDKPKGKSFVPPGLQRRQN